MKLKVSPISQTEIKDGMTILYKYGSIIRVGKACKIGDVTYIHDDFATFNLSELESTHEILNIPTDGYY